VNTTVIVFAKAPVPGFAKTRLMPALGAEGAAALAQRMLSHAVEQACLAGLGPVEICATPDTSHPSFAQLAAQHGVDLTSQGNGDLGQRMHRAFCRVLLPPAGRALLIGTDAPALNAVMLREAADLLIRHDAVFVPAIDGGYALVGLQCADPRWFSDMSWSTPSVMQTTRERLKAASAQWAELPPVADIDEPADLAHLPPAWLTSVSLPQLG
jgi:uncharacterized protein